MHLCEVLSRHCLFTSKRLLQSACSHNRLVSSLPFQISVTFNHFLSGGLSNIDDKTLTALSTTLALFHMQLNALMLLVDRHVAAGTVREDFQRLVSEGFEKGLFNRNWKTWSKRLVPLCEKRIRRSVLDEP